MASFYGGACTFVSFQFRPSLSRLDEAAQLLEQGAGGCAFAVELFDPVEPGQYCAGLVHVDEASVRNRTAMRRLRVFLDSVGQGAAARDERQRLAEFRSGNFGGHRTRTQSEDRLVE